MSKKQLRTFKLADDTYVETILPKGVSKSAKDRALEIINSTLQDDTYTETSELMSVLIEDNIKFIERNSDAHVERFFTALKFVAAKKTLPVVEAYEYVFPEKAEHLWELSNYSSDKYKAKVRRAVQAINETNSIVQGIETRLIVPSYILYSSYRDSAVENLKDLMNGKAKPSRVYAYEMENGRYVKDTNGLKVPVLDSFGNHIYQDEYQKVTPLVQVDAIKTMLSVTELPKEMSIDVNVSGSISKDESSLQREAVDILANIAKQMKEAVEASPTHSVDDVQQIGQYIDVTPENEDEEL